MYTRRQTNEETMPDWCVWALSELVAFTVLHQVFNCFDDLTRTGYSAVDAHLEQARQAWQTAENFDSFLNKLKPLFY